MTTQENGKTNLQMGTEYQDERRAVQKRIFTRWMNVYLSRREPPVEVHDLFRDIQDGKILMILLEELTGCKLLYRFRPSSHRIFRLNNISKALAFLDDRHVKLLGIDASAVADGVPSVVLNLIWNIILHFQVKEVTGGLHRRLSSSLSSLSTDLSEPNPGRAPASGPKYSGKTIKTLLQWVQKSTTQFGVEVFDFGKSWRSGLAFLALIKSINPDLVDMRKSFTRNPQENLELAFSTAQRSLDIPPLLEPQDVTCSSPGEKSIITYISMFLKHCPDMDEDTTAVHSPPISKFRSLETLVDTEDAQTLLSHFEPSTELLLWKRWARRSSAGSPLNASQQNRRRSSNVFQPPSPLDAIVVNPELRSWLDKSLDHGYSKTRADEILFSLSSEEGIYSVTPLDSDEEDAYDYILDLNKDVFQTQAKRKVPRVEEETAEEIMLQSNEELGISWNNESEVEIHELDAETKRNLDGKPASNYENEGIEEKSFDAEVWQDLQNSCLPNLNKEVVHPQAKRKVPRVEAEIAEEIIVQPNEELQTLEISWDFHSKVEEAVDDKELQINHSENVRIVKKIVVQASEGKTLETFWNNELDAETKRNLDEKEMAASIDRELQIANFTNTELLKNAEIETLEEKPFNFQPQNKRGVLIVTEKIAEETHVQPHVKLESEIESQKKPNLDGEEMELTDGNVELLKDAEKESLKSLKAVGKNKKEDCQNKNILDLSNNVSQTEVPRVKEETDEETIVQTNEELHVKILETSWNYKSEGKARRNLDFVRERKEIPAKEVSQMNKIQNVELAKHVETESLEDPNMDVIAERNLKAPSNNILIAHKRFEDAKVGNNMCERAIENVVDDKKDGDFKNEHRNLNDFEARQTINVDGLRLRCQTNYYVDSGCDMNSLTKICRECTEENDEKDLHSSDRDNNQMKLRCPSSTVDFLTESNSTSSTRSSSCRGVILQSVATSSGVSWKELEVLLLLWLFLYCFLVGRQLMS